jgi:hypothetical protein
MAVGGFDGIDVGVEQVNVVEKRVVLFFGLNEGRHDFLNAGNAGSFLNLGEGVLDNFDVTGIHIHQGALLLVVSLPTGKTGLQEGDGVSELSSVSGFFSGVETFSLSLVKLTIVSFLEFLLEIENLVLEGKFVNLVLSLEGKNLIVGVLTETLAIVSLLVQLLNVVN